MSTTTSLLSTMKELKDKYGALEELHDQSTGPKDLEKRLQKLKRIRPVIVSIFLRELRTIWEKAKPEPSRIATEMAQRIELKNVGFYESALVRLSLENCKKAKCVQCPVRDHCRNT